MHSTMKTRSFLAVSLAVAFVVGATAIAAEVSVTTGAGYQKMLQALCQAYRDQGGEVEEMYGGPVGQMLVQITQGSGATIVVSDRCTLEASKAGVAFDTFQDLGDTLLVLAWRKGVTIESPEDLAKPEIASVCHPDPEIAIYGRAAAAFLASSGIGEKIKGKLSVISTVPQVFAYLVSGEMDAGFVNRVMILNGADKIGGSLEIEDGYPSLNMVAAVVQGHGDNAEIGKFLEFLETAEAKEILRKNGVW